MVTGKDFVTEIKIGDELVDLLGVDGFHFEVGEPKMCSVILNGKIIPANDNEKKLIYDTYQMILRKRTNLKWEEQ